MNVQSKQIHQYSGNTILTALVASYLARRSSKNVFILSDDMKILLDAFYQNVVLDGIGKDIELMTNNIKDTESTEDLKPYCYRIGESNAYIIPTENMEQEYVDKLLEIRDSQSIIFYDTKKELENRQINCFFNIINPAFNVKDIFNQNRTTAYRTLYIFNYFDTKCDNERDLKRKYELQNSQVQCIEYTNAIRRYCKQGKLLRFVDDMLLGEMHTILINNQVNAICNFIEGGKLR